MLLDFGAAWDEHEEEPLVVRVRPFDATEDEEHTLPGSMPAGLRLHLWATRADAGESAATAPLSYGDLQVAGRFLFGQATFQRWLDLRVTENRLTAVVMRVVAEYAAREGRFLEAPDPKDGGASEAPPTSSTTSGSSKPTSPASTASTSPGTSGG